jgi:hypothetical protein
MKNISICLCALFLSASLISCKSQEVISVEGPHDKYSYSVGLGESVFLQNNSMYEDVNFIDFVVNNFSDDQFPTASIDSIELADGEFDNNCFTIDTFSYMRDLSFTCLKEFDKAIQIKTINYKFGKYIIKMPYDITLTYNPDYNTYPFFPASYLKIGDLGLNGDKDLHYLFKTFYIEFGKGYGRKSSSFIVNSFASENSFFEITNLEYASMISGFSFDIHYDTIEYHSFERLDMDDFTFGFVLKFNIRILDESLITIGGDGIFHVNVNGDDYVIPYHLYYCPSEI